MKHGPCGIQCVVVSLTNCFVFVFFVCFFFCLISVSVFRCTPSIARQSSITLEGSVPMCVGEPTFQIGVLDPLNIITINPLWKNVVTEVLNQSKGIAVAL